MGDSTGETRRCFLCLAGSLATSTALAGCGGDSGGGSNRSATTTGAEFEELAGPVPDVYREAESLNGGVRNPHNLSTKSQVAYQSEPRDGERCVNCGPYIEDKNGDGLGACTLVEGLIEPEGWCAVYTPLQTDG